MYDVKTQLRAFLEETPEVTLDEILSVATEEAGPDRARPQQVSPRRGLLVAVGTAAAVLLIVGIVGAVMLASRSTVSDPVTPSVTTTTIATTPIRVDELVWSRIATEAAVFTDAWIGWVTVFDGELVAVGEDVSGAAAWTSPDGLTWARVPIDEAAFGGRLETIAEGGPGLVAVGGGQAYTSLDGAEWMEALCPECSPDGEFGYVADLAVGESGLVAVGNATDEGTGTAFLWTSADGITWTRVAYDGIVEMEGVTAGGPGFVAVGHSPSGAEVLTSSDGTSWSQLPRNEDVFGGSLLRSVVAMGDGLVALGEWPWGSGQAWTSLDGIQWARVPDVEEVFDGASIHDAAIFGDRLIAVGDSSIWIAAPPGSIEVATAAAPESEPNRLVTGEAVNPWRTTEITEPWARDVVDVAVLPEGGFAVASRYGGGVFWSPDGESWRDANPNGLASLPAWPDDDDLRVIAALPGRLALLDSSQPAVWLGDLATGEWDVIEPNWEDTDPSDVRMVIASNEEQILVAGRYWDSDNRTVGVVTWLIDPDTGRVDHGALPLGFAASAGTWNGNGLEAVWFGDRWVIAAGNSTAVSDDGLNWATNRDGDGLASSDRFVASLTASSSGLMASSCEWAHHAWFSEDGLTWTEKPAVPAGHYGFAYSNSLGFVVVSERVFTSPDGRAWKWTLGPQLDDNIIDLAASGSSVFVLTKTQSVAAIPYVMTLE
ncbi:MAG: hypothetical protein QNJ77_14540 [Acidimicrobiia bacterium]|nr:hypothetical protein [Acidimicrobiia bacterium]